MSEDAVVRRIGHTNPPSLPMELRGKEQIGVYWRDVFGREMTHRIEKEVAGDD